MNNIVVVGGGTAGWLTALYLQNIYKDTTTITLIESKDIGILGAGEGSVPVMYSFLEELNIDISDFIIKTNATHKLGVNFVNWNGDNTQYFHSFGPYKTEDSYFGYDGLFMSNEYIGYLYDHESTLNTSLLQNKIALDGASPFFLDDDKKVNAHSRFSYHFDAHLVAKYLREIAETRNIRRIEGIVSKFNLDSNNEISEIVLEGGETIKSDFVFDCSGFHRLVIGKLYKTKWIHYNDQLKVNKAVTFTLPTDSVDIGSYTNAIAMKYGWMWQIPLQNRIGCGYNFDSTYIDENDAIKELEEYFGYNPQINQIISYNAGRFENAWVGNCIAVGLSLGFTEPIEATSIFHSIAQLSITTRDVLDNYKKGLSFSKSKIQHEYNRIIANAQDSTLIFLYFHYFTKRNDTPFWKDYLSKTRIPKTLQNLLDKWKVQPIQLDDFLEGVHGFKYHNWMAVADGLDYLNKDIYLKLYRESNEKSKIYNHHLKLTNSYFDYKKKIVTDSNFIQQLKK
jgi:tryptophan halogenase